MATAEISLTPVRDDGSCLDATVQSSGTDEQVREECERLGLGDVLTRAAIEIRRERGPRKCSSAPANDSALIEVV